MVCGFAPQAGGNTGLNINDELSSTLQANQQMAVAQNGYRMAAFGEYVEDGTSSTLKQRDYKDATDLVVDQCLTPWDSQTERIHTMGGTAPTVSSPDGQGGAYVAFAQNTLTIKANTQMVQATDGARPVSRTSSVIVHVMVLDDNHERATMVEQSLLDNGFRVLSLLTSAAEPGPVRRASCGISRIA